MPNKPANPRLKKLAKNLDAMAAQDEVRLRRSREIGALRRQASSELHDICRGFVRDLNALLSQVQLEFAPEQYDGAGFRDSCANLFQINARGRILQIKFEATEELVSTEEFRVPYIMAGSVRCFNQELLEKDLIEEQLLFYTMEKSHSLWRFFDPRTYRSGAFDADYLAGLLEQLV